MIIKAAQVTQELNEQAKEMRKASAPGEKLGLNDDELASYDALETNDSAVQVLVLQRQFREGCGVMPAWRRGAWHGSVWPVRYCPAYPQATAATRLARTVPGAAFPAPPGRPAAS